MIGRLNKERKIDLLLQVFKIVQENNPKTCLLVIGEGEYLVPARRLVKNLNLKKVFFTGAIYNERDLGIYYSLSDIFTTTGAASLTIKSAMAYKKPVVSMNMGLEIHSIRNGYNGYIIEFGNIKEMADKILYLLHNDTQRIFMSLNAIEVINNSYNISLMVDGFINAIYSIRCNRRNN